MVSGRELGGRAALSVIAGVTCVGFSVPLYQRASSYGYYDEVGMAGLLALAGVLMIAGGAQLLSLKSRVKQLEP
ncbi:MAG TPA: hypothetical protein PKA88_39010 [Polyangiaceae bacterium]|nr:hypothetical protein [Polyangiaceae bacterium]HMR78442.1 hypothetical protein [Polyangiaceae bacterium]